MLQSYITNPESPLKTICEDCCIRTPYLTPLKAYEQISYEFKTSNAAALESRNLAKHLFKWQSLVVYNVCSSNPGMRCTSTVNSQASGH